MSASHFAPLEPLCAAPKLRLNETHTSLATPTGLVCTDSLSAIRRDDWVPKPRWHAEMSRPAPQSEGFELRKAHGRNVLIDSLSGQDAGLLLPHLERTTLVRGQVLLVGWRSPLFVHFPTTAVVSFQYGLASGDSAEFAVVGFEGAVGFPLQMPGHTSAIRAAVTCAGEALRLPAAVIQQQAATSALRAFASNCALEILEQAALSTVCSHAYSLLERLCKLLLVRLDRLPGHTIETTHEALALALAVRREGVTQAAGRLQSDGLIRYTRGHIEVLDRTRLEQRACECYRDVKLRDTQQAC